jgi:Helix-turn-helix domain
MTKKYVSVQSEREYEVVGGEQQVKPRIFLKMYTDAVHDGLIAALGADLWQTLCVVAAFMDEEGRCYPSQDLIAHRLGVSRQAANNRLKRLEEFRWKEQPIIKRVKHRGEGQKWENTIYTIMPLSCLDIF